MGKGTKFYRTVTKTVTDISKTAFFFFWKEKDGRGRSDSLVCACGRCGHQFRCGCTDDALSYLDVQMKKELLPFGSSPGIFLEAGKMLPVFRDRGLSCPECGHDIYGFLQEEGVKACIVTVLKGGSRREMKSSGHLRSIRLRDTVSFGKDDFLYEVFDLSFEKGRGMQIKSGERRMSFTASKTDGRTIFTDAEGHTEDGSLSGTSTENEMMEHGLELLEHFKDWALPGCYYPRFCEARETLFFKGDCEKYERYLSFKEDLRRHLMDDRYNGFSRYLMDDRYNGFIYGLFNAPAEERVLMIFGTADVPDELAQLAADDPIEACYCRLFCLPGMGSDDTAFMVRNRDTFWKNAGKAGWPRGGGAIFSGRLLCSGLCSPAFSRSRHGMKSLAAFLTYMAGHGLAGIVRDLACEGTDPAPYRGLKEVFMERADFGCLLSEAGKPGMAAAGLLCAVEAAVSARERTLQARTAGTHVPGTAPEEGFPEAEVIGGYIFRPAELRQTRAVFNAAEMDPEQAAALRRCSVFFTVTTGEGGHAPSGAFAIDMFSPDGKPQVLWLSRKDPCIRMPWGMIQAFNRWTELHGAVISGITKRDFMNDACMSYLSHTKPWSLHDPYLEGPAARKGSRSCDLS